MTGNKQTKSQKKKNNKNVIRQVQVACMHIWGRQIGGSSTTHEIQL